MNTIISPRPITTPVARIDWPHWELYRRHSALITKDAQEGLSGAEQIELRDLSLKLDLLEKTRP